MTTLKRLYLSNNSITDINVDGLSKLLLLSLENNALKQVPTLNDLPNLVHLDLNGNPLEGLPFSTFHYLKPLLIFVLRFL